MTGMPVTLRFELAGSSVDALIRDAQAAANERVDANLTAVLIKARIREDEHRYRGTFTYRVVEPETWRPMSDLEA